MSRVLRHAVIAGVAAAAMASAPLVGSAAAVAPLLPAPPDLLGSLLPDEVCGGLERLDVPDLDEGLGLCTHGPDAAPAARASGAGSPVPTRRLTCIGDGSSGQRVQVLYLHGPGAPAASSTRLREVQRWVEQVEWTVHESARRLGGDRRVRWQTDGDCRLQVTSRRVSTAAMGDFGTMIRELRDLGYRSSNRTYMLFVDDRTYCGIATAPRDDARTNNTADRLAGYARVDRSCWWAADNGYHSIAAHELLHTLGAVQASAPNGTKGAHCTDEHDLLCYDDGSGEGVRTVCRDSDASTSGSGDLNDRLLDCRGDDYFNPAPRSGSYLDRHWNTANSARLLDPNAPPPSGGSSGGGGGSSPSPTGNPVGWVLDIVFD